MPQVPTTTPADALRILGGVLLPVVAKGPIVRRPRAVGLAERADTDSHSVTVLQGLRERYGQGPVQVTLPGRRLVMVLDPEDVHRVLDQTPVPFTPASLEKRGALGHFQPEGSLVSTPQQRLHRRPFNEAVLGTGQTLHEQVDHMVRAVEEEVDALLGQVDFSGTLDWAPFATTWWRIVRRVVLGDSARDDEGLTDDLLRLRRRANLSYLMPRDKRLQQRFLAGVQDYVDRAEAGSLVSGIAAAPRAADTQPHQQVPQWLFAFDAAAWASFRSLALLTSAPGAVDRAREEMAGAPDLPYLRSAVLESLRLWPTTPLILRDTTQETVWRNGTLPAGAAVVLFAPFFHRDDQRLEQAHRFDPELWLTPRTEQDWPLVPFSGGPGMCPGRNVTLLVASSVLGRLLARRQLRPQRPLDTDQLPGTLSPFHLRFAAAG